MGMVLFAANLQAQDSCYSSIQGIVGDPDGLPLANVIVEEIWTGFIDTTDGSGFYILEFDSVAWFALEFRYVGYGVYRDGFELLCRDTTLDVSLWPGCDYTPGDVNGNGSFNGIDVTAMVSYFKGGSTPAMDCGNPVGPCPQPSPFYAAGDVNGDCVFNGMDLIWFVIHLKGGPAPLRYCPTCPPAYRG
jgi:hypothetical protein